MSSDVERPGIPGMSAIYDPGGHGTAPSMDLRTDEDALPKKGDVITVEGWYGSTARRVKDVADHGGGRVHDHLRIRNRRDH